MNDAKKSVLITGINGFVGSHLAEECAARGWLVHGTLRSHRSNVNFLADPAYKLHGCDVNDYVAVAAVLAKAKPDYVFHLAAQSYVPVSWKAPRQTLETNLLGTMNVLEAVRHESPDSAVQVAGSSEEYGLVRIEECPITEAQPLRPLSPYGVSKAAADLLAQQYAASYGLRIVVTRAFNHTGPRRGELFAESDWASRIARAEADGEPAKIFHGNLDAVRDYTHVRDVVLGYILAAERGASGAVYNLASGDMNALTMGDVLKLLAKYATVPVELCPDPARMRPSDVPRLCGDPTKAVTELGWKPRAQIAETMLDLLNYWRAVWSARRREKGGAISSGEK